MAGRSSELFLSLGDRWGGKQAEQEAMIDKDKEARMADGVRGRGAFIASQGAQLQTASGLLVARRPAGAAAAKIA